MSDRNGLANAMEGETCDETRRYVKAELSQSPILLVFIRFRSIEILSGLYQRAIQERFASSFVAARTL